MASDVQPSSVACLDDMPGRFKEQFAQVNLTLVSIIQASVLGYMIAYIHNPPGQLTLWISVRLFASFLYVVGLWYGYTCQAIAFRWVPGLADAALPFVLGAFELLTVRSVGSVFWWCMCNAGLALTGAVSYLHLCRNAARHPENAPVLCRLTRQRRLNPALMAACAAWYVALAVLFGRRGGAGGITTIGGLLPPIAYLVWSPVGHRMVLRRDAGSRADTK